MAQVMTRTPHFLERHRAPTRAADFVRNDTPPALPAVEVGPAPEHVLQNATTESTLDVAAAVDRDLAAAALAEHAHPTESVSTAPASTPGDDLILERLGHALQTLKLQTNVLAEAVRSDALEIGFQVARRILEQEVSGDVSALMSLVKSAVRRVSESRHLKVRVSAMDLPLLEAALHEGHAPELSVAHLELVGDPLLKRGDVMVDGDLGTVDGRMETRLDEVRRNLASHVHSTAV